MSEQKKKEVLEKIRSTRGLQEALRVSCIEWGNPVVGIHPFLMDTAPSKGQRTFTGMEQIPAERYELILSLWRNNLIGGSVRWNGECTRKYWDPPKGSQLFQLMRIEHDWDSRPSWTYYLLLLEDGRHFFLEKKGGYNCELKILEERDDALHLGDALSNVLMWKPKPTEDE